MRILPGIIAMATIVVASNILVQFLILDGLLTWGAFTYPLAFLVTDIMNRVYGVAAARRVVWAGLVVGIICSLIGTQITQRKSDGKKLDPAAQKSAKNTEKPARKAASAAKKKSEAPASKEPANTDGNNPFGSPEMIPAFLLRPIKLSKPAA